MVLVGKDDMILRSGQVIAGRRSWKRYVTMFQYPNPYIAGEYSQG